VETVVAIADIVLLLLLVFLCCATMVTENFAAPAKAGRVRPGPQGDCGV
jgi:hypothetical protein